MHGNHLRNHVCIAAMMRRVNELSLFSGAGGGLLGTKLLGWKHIGYVEFNEYCQKVIRQRIKDGILDEAPIFSDIRAFIDQGYAEAYQDMVDVLSGGFPCQPFSVAGKGLGADDPRNMWPVTIECIRIIRPQYCLLENVPGLLAHRYVQRIFGDLAEAGYDTRWCVLGADDMGANHRRKRLWIVAHAKGSECEWAGAPRRGRDGFTDKSFDMADTNESGSLQRQPQIVSAKKGESSFARSAECGENVSDPGRKHKRGPQKSERTSDHTPRHNRQWSTEPNVGRVANGVASRVDRLKAIGNGQVPAVVRAAWMILNGD